MLFEILGLLYSSYAYSLLLLGYLMLRFIPPIDIPIVVLESRPEIDVGSGRSRRSILMFDNSLIFREASFPAIRFERRTR